MSNCPALLQGSNLPCNHKSNLYYGKFCGIHKNIYLESLIHKQNLKEAKRLYDEKCIKRRALQQKCSTRVIFEWPPTTIPSRVELLTQELKELREEVTKHAVSILNIKDNLEEHNQLVAELSKDGFLSPNRNRISIKAIDYDQVKLNRHSLVFERGHSKRLLILDQLRLLL